MDSIKLARCNYLENQIKELQERKEILEKAQDFGSLTVHSRPNGNSLKSYQIEPKWLNFGVIRALSLEVINKEIQAAEAEFATL